MPKNTHKRKVSAHSKSKTVKKNKVSAGRAPSPKIFIGVGVILVALGLYLLLFKAHGNAMTGFAMLAIIIGVVAAIIAIFSAPDKKTG
ncbi:hypothetical protein SAMN03080615_00319 [Amphritea atlantica]|uniref:Uncharacterized protein n=1 Tax=Amphritea atlantica TaxID=355243 RepID=A0A1H9D4Y3_9GAMM|nr:hypothetical protein [Amphritea atlantica]SEQ07913.1 hypothetical protein SAMN03080615_00319 [Amphritea atlantica]